MNGRLKKAIGPSSWCSTAPKPEPEASQSTTKSRVKSGKWRTGAADSAAFSLPKAVDAASVHWKLFFRSSCVSGVAMAP